MTIIQKSWCLFYILILLSANVNCQRTEWDANNFPNPTAGDFKRCNMKTTANICDPDQVLTEQQRYRLNHELHQLESRTRQSNAPDFCQKKGITAAMGIAKHVRGSSEQVFFPLTKSVKEMANVMLKTWRLDDQCQKSVVIVVATEDKRFWVARDPRVPVYAAEFTQIFKDQRQLFESKDYPQALANILQQTWEKAISKQGPSGASDGGGGRGAPVPKRPDDIHPIGPKTPTFPKIPMWIWFAILFVLIPLLCCCCICYCCFCRGKGSSSPRRQGASDIEGGGMGGAGYPQGQRRNRGGGMNGFLGALGGAGIGNIAGRLLSGGGGGRGLFGGGSRGGGVPQHGYQGGGAYPAGPSYPSSKPAATGGLYPSVAVKDEGGGGSW